MKKLLFLSLTIALSLSTISACGEAVKSANPKTNGGQSIETKNSVNNEDVIQEVSSKKTQQDMSNMQNEDMETAKKENSDTVISEPYIPLPPAKTAKPLKDKYTEEEIAKMPTIEAHGDSRVRGVPFGQTLQKGALDHTNGPLKKYRLVSFYGNPHSTHMGILGELDPEALMKKLKTQTQAYSDADPARPAIPTIELITTIAQRNPGPNGLYYHSTSEKDLVAYSKLAKENGAILLLDVQLGQDTIMHQVKLIEDYLKLPYVYLAIDTEFHVKKGEVPGVDLGHVDGRKIQEAIEYVSDLVEKNNLPDKVVVVHQFKGDIIQNKEAIHPTDHVEVVLNFDGFGIPGVKMAGYHGLVQKEPVQYGGFKLFYKNDQPLLTPKDVLTLDPAPAFIDYQ